MAVIDLQALLSPVSEEQPCGETLEDTQAYFALDHASQFKEGGALGGDGAEPDWPDVKRQALALAMEGKDIRVAVHLTAALLRTDGWAGFSEGLQLLHGYLEQYWDDVYPLVEDGDPYFRVNALFNLSDPQRFVNALRRTPVVQSRMAGAYSLRDHLAATAVSRQQQGVDDDEGPHGPSASHSASHSASRSLFGNLPGLQSVEDADDLSGLVDQLRARLGQDTCYTLEVEDQHTPERAWKRALPLRHTRPPTRKQANKPAGKRPGKQKTKPQENAPRLLKRPLWLFDPPRPVDRRQLALLRGPERIHTGWWLDGGDELHDPPGQARDYYVARHHSGARCWVFTDPRQRWFLHGYFS
jgi:type VI secretion system protein ImpA